MARLNLINPENSDIRYKISKFPDGQQNIVLDKKWTTTVGYPSDAPKEASSNYEDEIVQIYSRLNNWLHLELIVASISCLREIGVKKIHLYVPYFLGARSDRKFEDGGNWYLKQVLCPIINSLGLDKITVLDAHSSVLGNLLNNFEGVDNTHFVAHHALPEIIKEMKLPDVLEETRIESPIGLFYDYRGLNNIILVSPDAGASHKIQSVANAIGYKDPIVVCTKERDAEGKLTDGSVPVTSEQLESGKAFIIIDDICDGGRTFINIAEVIKRQEKNARIYLVITHGIFSAGFEELGKYFDGIYCTNSYKDITFPWIMKGYLGRNSSQLNVFI